MSNATATAPANTNPEAEVENPFAGFFGLRNGVQVPFVIRNVLKGVNKDKPYLTLDVSKLSDSDFIKAVGIQSLKELAEVKINQAARSIAEDITDEKLSLPPTDWTNDQLAEFQKWADGVVEARVSKSELWKRFKELAQKMNWTDEETQEFADIRLELQRRARAGQ